jgi:hypothetical protein
MVRQVQIIERGSGAVIEQRLEQAHTAIKVTRPSTIRIAMSKEAVVGWEREQGDLVIRFADGTSLRIEGYFDCTPDLSNELIFAEPDGELWRATVTTAEGEVCLAETAGSDVLSATFERIAEQGGAAGWFSPMYVLGGVAAVGAAAALANSGGSKKSPPPAPTVNPANGKEFSGSAAPGSTVQLDLDGDGRPDLTTTADSNGNWSVTPSTPVPDGTVVRVTAVDSSGKVSAPTEVIVDAIAPAAPVVYPSNGTSLRGTAEPGSRVTIDLDGDGEPDVTTTADSNGNWSVTLDEPLADGTVVTATATDAAGNVSGEGQVVIDAVAPTLTVTAPIGGDGVINAGDAANGVQIGGVSDAEDGQVVTITVTSSSGSSITLTAPVQDGVWGVELTPEQLASLEDGTITVSVSVSDQAGNTTTSSETFTLDVTPPGAVPTLGATGDDVGPITGAISSGGSTDDRRPTFSGSGAEPGGSVNIYDNGELIGTVPVNADGTWSFTPDEDLGEGAHSITFSNVDAAGNEGAQSTPFEFTVDTQAPTTAPTVGGIIDDVGLITGVINDGDVTDDKRPTFSGTGGEPGGTVNVYDNGELIGSATVNADGSWSFTPPNDLGDGAHSLTFSNVDAAGNEGPASAPITMTVDTQAPTNAPVLDGDVEDDVVPVTTPVVHGGATNDPRPTFNGSGAEPGGTVRVYDNGVLIGTVPVNADGTWSFTPEEDLDDGPHSITFTNVDAAGNEGVSSAPFEFTSDTQAPTSAPVVNGGVQDDVVPVTTPVFSGGATNDTTPTFTGSGAEPGTKINVYDDGELIDTVTVGADGTWSYTPTTPLDDGPHSITFSNEDAAGNEGPPSAPFELVVDTAPPAAPVLGGVEDDVEGDTGPLSDGDLTNDTRPTFTGTAEPGTTIRVYDNGNFLEEVTVGADGTWSYTPTQPLSDAAHSITFTNVDLAGNEGPASEPYTFTVDGTPPMDAPVVKEHTDDVGAITGEIPEGEITDDATPTFSGSGAEPNSTVNIYDGDELIGSTTADADGNWSFTPTNPLDDGPHSITFTNVDQAGNEGPHSDPFVFQVDSQAPLTSPTLGSAVADTGPTPVQIVNGGLTNDARPTFTGSGAEPNSTVNVYDGGELIGSVVADADGNWSFTPQDDLDDGPHSITFTNVDLAGNEGPHSDPFQFSSDTQPPSSAPLVDGTVQDDVIPVTTPVPNGGATNDPTPTFTGSGAEPNSTINVYDGNELIDSVTVNADGTWSWTPQQPLDEGAHSITFTNVDQAGNEGPSSDPFTLTIDTQAPSVEPVLDRVEDDVEQIKADVVAGGSTNDPRPTFHGSGAEPNSTIRVYDDGNLIGTASADANGNWSFTPSSDLDQGEHSFTFSIVDLAGQEGPQTSTPFVFTVDTIAPNAAPELDDVLDNVAPGIGSVANGGSTNDPRPLFTGSAEEPGSTIRIYNNGTLFATTTVQADGTWSFQPQADLADATYSFTFSVVDPAGNEGPQSDTPFVFTVDTHVPTSVAYIDSISDDTGISNSDFLTKEQSVTVYGHLGAPLASGERIEISVDGGATWNQVTVVSGTSWSYAVGPLAGGTYNLVTRVIGSSGIEGDVDTRTLTIDTTLPPVMTISHIAPDTGTDDGDFITSSSSVTVHGTLLEQLDAGERAQISIDGGQTWVDVNVMGTTWTYTDPRSLGDGQYEYEIRTIDAAGNIRTGIAQQVTVDATAPSGATIDEISADTGLSDADYITNATTFTVSGHLYAPLNAGERVEISLNGADWIEVDNVIDTDWEHAITDPLPEGPNTLRVRVIDAAGNASAPVTRTVIVDTQAPAQMAMPTFEDSIELDVGSITNGSSTNDASPVIRGTAEPNSKVLIYSAHGLDDYGPPVEVLADADGKWTYTPPTLADGQWRWYFTNVDVAGNEGPPTSVFTFTVDTQDPPGATIVSLANDSGESNSDFITSSKTITLNGTFTAELQPGETAWISADGGATWEQITAISGTDWTWTDLTERTDGTYLYEVYVRDAANNVGQSDTKKVVVDTTAPDAITIESIAVDTGLQSNDFITAATPVELRGSLSQALATGDNAEKAQISLDGGVTWQDLTVVGTQWSFLDNRPLVDGDYEYQVRIIDLAGNVSAATQIVTVDTTPPLQATITAIAPDTGAPDDFVTASTEITVLGTVEGALDPGDRVQVSLDGGASWGDAVIDSGNWTWSYNVPGSLTDGNYNVQVRTIDLAGNIRAGSNTRTILVDTKAPTQEAFIDSIDADTGISSSDFITSDVTPTIRGHLSAPLGSNEFVEVSLDGMTWHVATVDGTNWSYAAGPLDERVYTVYARVVDTAGNAASMNSAVITIDLTPPAAPVVQHYVDDVGETTGNRLSDTTTDDDSPLLVGTLGTPAQAGWQLRIYDDATLIGTLNLSAGQTDWTYQLEGLADGIHNLSVVVANAAGVESAAAPFTLTVETTPPVVTMLSIDGIDTDTHLANPLDRNSDNDFVTRAVTIKVRGTASFDGGVLQISNDGGATWFYVTSDSGAWEFEDSTAQNGDVTYMVRVVNASGQVAPVTAQRTVTVDHIAPVATTLAPVLAAAYDTGVLGDNVTTTQIITFSSNESGLKDPSSTILLVNDVNRNGIFDVNDVILGMDASSSDTWSITKMLPQGQYSLAFVQVDAAGNYSRMTPTTNISIYASDDHRAGNFQGVSPSAAGNLHVGMAVGISPLGELQLAVRHVTITQTSDSGGVNTTHGNPSASSTITNNTYLDFNRDGYIDYATSDNVYSDHAQTIFVGQDHGVFEGQRFKIGNYTVALGGVVAFDKEGDGWLDLIWGDWGNDNLPGMIVNDGGDLLAQSVLAPGLTLYPDREVSGVDIDNDGDIDLALHSYRINGTTSAYAFTLLSNDGSGVYSVAQTVADVFNNTSDNAGTAVSMTWADFDGDGDLDLYLNRTRDTNVSGIFLNEGGKISVNKIPIGDVTNAIDGAVSLAIDWNHDGRMDIVEFARPNTTGPIQLYLNTTSPGGALTFDAPVIQLATGVTNIAGAAAADYDWDGDVDIIYALGTTGQVKSIENLNQVRDGTSLHLRILDKEGFNVFYGNTVQLFDSQGRLVATQILNPQSGVGTNDSTGIVHFYNLSPYETYTVALVRSVNGVSQDVSGVASLSGGASNLQTVEVVNRTWTGLRPGASRSAYVLIAEGDGEVNGGSYAGTGYNDTFFATAGNDTFIGGGGWTIGIAGPSAWSADGGMDIVDYSADTVGVTVRLYDGSAEGFAQGFDTLIGIEGVRGGSGNDLLVDSAGDNLLEGRGGDDQINLMYGGQDIVVYQLLDPLDATGGNGQDIIYAFTVGDTRTELNTDVLDLRDLLKGYTGPASAYWDVTAGAFVLDYASRGLLDYLRVEVSGSHTLIQVDLQQTGTFTTIATLYDVQTSLDELLGNGQLWLNSSHTTPHVIVNELTTFDDTPIVSGTLPFALGPGQQFRVQIGGVTYSSANAGEIVIDPANNTWYVQVTTPLAAGTYSVTAAVWNGNGSLAAQDRTSYELTIASAPAASFGASGTSVNKATALTLGEDGTWRVFSNDTVFDSAGADSATLGKYRAIPIGISGESPSAATFMDYNRDGYMDLFGLDADVGDGQIAWRYDGLSYHAFQVGGSGNTSANVYAWHGGVVAYDKTGDGYADLVYGDEQPNTANLGGGYDSQFVINNGDGTFVKDRTFTDGAMGSPAPTNSGNAQPHKEVSGVDINNDGTVDIVFHANELSSYTGGPAKTAGGSNIYRLVVVTNYGDGTLYSTQVLNNVFYVSSGSNTNAPSMTWADFNGDGYMDLFLGRGRFTPTGTTADSLVSRILYNDHGTLVQSLTGDYATTFLGDSLEGGASLAVDWDRDGRMDVIELPEYGATGTNPVNLYTNNGDGSFATTALASVPQADNITGAVAMDFDWDGDKDLVFFRSSGATTYVRNDSAPVSGGSLHLRIVDGEGINAFFGNTVQLYDSAGNLVASQIINPQSGLHTSDSSAIVDFHGLDANESYTAVLLTHVNGVSNDVGGVAVAGGNTIERVNATWSGLRVGAPNEAYVLTAEADTDVADTIGPGIVGTGYNDRFFATLGNDVYNGGGGWRGGEWSNTGGEDIVDFVLAGSTGVSVDLSLTTAQNTGFNTATFINIEGVAGTAGDDVFIDNSADNVFEGRGGNDTIRLENGGNDSILYRLLEAADATGGNGADTIIGFKVGLYEATPNADRIDLKELLIGYTGDADGAAHYVNGVATLDAGETIGQYLQVTTVDGDTVISIDRDGAGTEFDFTVLATLEGVTTDLETLLANHQLIAA